MDTRRIWTLSATLFFATFAGLAGCAKAQMNGRMEQMPLVLSIETSTRDTLKGFLKPKSGEQSRGLRLIEPYQRGKIPVVLTHGLLSNASTWNTFVEAFNANSALQSNYQLLVFNYPTGQAFLRTAADLRRELKGLELIVNQNEIDPAFSEMILVGHSMGGLISKLVVTDSGNAIWSSIANKPIDSVRIQEPIRSELEEVVYFAASPNVKKVIFVGTPHQGSKLAISGLGKFGSAVIRQPFIATVSHRKLVLKNPGVFSREFCRGIPTSIDLLEPTSPLLRSISTLQVSGDVSMYSIIGTGKRMGFSGDSDGVVPVSSARINGAESEIFIQDRHTKLHQNPATIAEIFSILQQHINQNHGHQSMRVRVNSSLPMTFSGEQK